MTDWVVLMGIQSLPVLDDPVLDDEEGFMMNVLVEGLRFSERARKPLARRPPVSRGGANLISGSVQACLLDN